MTKSAFDSSNPKIAELAAMRDELAKETRNLQWKQVGYSALGGALGAIGGIAGATAMGLANSGVMAPVMGGMLGSRAGSSVSDLFTAEQKKKLELNQKILEAETSRINAQNWGQYYAAPANAAPIAPPPFPATQQSLVAAR